LKSLPFLEAKEYVHKLKLKSSKDWIEYCKSGKKPTGIPYSPNRTYKNYWNGWSDWLGTITPREIPWRPFEEARKFVHRLTLKTRDEWSDYCKSGKKPKDIPNNPNQTYKMNWKGIGDWLGTNRVANKEKQFLSFFEARKFARTLGLSNAREWEIYRKSQEMPNNIPANPNRTYKKEWKGYGDWLGTGNLWPHDIREHIRPYVDARKFTHSLGLKSRHEWNAYCKSGKKPYDIPSAPHLMYKQNWKGYGDWLGTGTIAPQMRKYRTFEAARDFVIQLGLKSEHEWRKYSKSGKKPDDIPAHPSTVYKSDWKGMGDWLGTGTIAPRYRKYRAFEEAREFARSLELNNVDEWLRYCKSGKKPDDIPTAPWKTYRNDWRGIFDWLGYEEKVLSVGKVKELLKDLIQSRIIYNWDEAVLYSFLLRKGLLNLRNNRHANFFKNLIEVSRTERGKKLIEGYAYSDSEIPPDFSNSLNIDATDSEEIEAASLSDFSNAENKDPLDYGNIESVEQILEHTNVLESFNVDEEAMQFYLDYSIDELWRHAFKNEDDTLRKVRLEGKNGNKYHDTVLNNFLKDYQGSTKLKVPDDYSFPYPPGINATLCCLQISQSSLLW